jgi:hypothetical protein
MTNDFLRLLKYQLLKCVLMSQMFNLQYNLVHVVDVSKVVLGVLVVVEHVDDGGGSVAGLSDKSTGRPGQIFSDDDVLN